jgi:hypothetical protein
MTRPPKPLTSVAALERAAQQTIETAAAALLWPGDDNYGVLAHVAAADPAIMAYTRRICDEAMIDKDLLPNMAHALRLVSPVYGFELAALPESVASHWAATVREAWQASHRELDRDLPSKEIPAEACAWRPEDPAQHRRNVLKSHALWACSLWSRERLQVNAIEAITRVAADAVPPSFG